LPVNSRARTIPLYFRLARTATCKCDSYQTFDPRCFRTVPEHSE
jgi:hypothetical protein